MEEIVLNNAMVVCNLPEQSQTKFGANWLSSEIVSRIAISLAEHVNIGVGPI